MKRFGIAVLALCAISSVASAGLIGQSVLITGELPLGNALVSTEVVVGAGIEVPGNFENIYEIDLSDTNILISLPGTCHVCGGFTASSFNGLHFFDVNGTIGNITSVTIASNTVEGFGSERLAFDENNIYLNFASLDPSTSAVLSLDITTDASAAPEPSAWMLMAGGAVSLIAMRRKRRG